MEVKRAQDKDESGNVKADISVFNFQFSSFVLRSLLARIIQCATKGAKDQRMRDPPE